MSCHHTLIPQRYRNHFCNADIPNQLRVTVCDKRDTHNHCSNNHLPSALFGTIVHHSHHPLCHNNMSKHHFTPPSSSARTVPPILPLTTPTTRCASTTHHSNHPLCLNYSPQHTNQPLQACHHVPTNKQAGDTLEAS